MQSRSLKRNTVLHRIFGGGQEPARCPWLNKAICAYVGVTVVTYVLFLVVPFVTFLASTPLYSIKSYLGILGALLLVVDVFTNKVLWRGPWCGLLYGVCAAAALSLLRMASYGIKDNLFDLCWVVIQFGLVYSCACRMDAERLKSFLRRLFGVISAIWFCCCWVSFYQYLSQTGYLCVCDPNSDSPELTRQGFLESRLFGVFTNIDHAVYTSLAVFIGCVHYIVEAKKKGTKVVLAAIAATVICHMILSGSRSVQIALFLYLFCLSWLLLRNRMGRRHVVACILLSACITAAGWLVWQGAKAGLAELPTGYARLEAALGITQTAEEEVPAEDMLQRTDTQSLGNHRLEIWQDYLSLHSEIGPVGLSLANFNDYIAEKHPDLFIVQWFAPYADSGKSDLVFECHNNYLFVFVATGYLGAALFAAFLLLGAARVIRYIRRNPRLSMGFISALAVVCIGFVQALFMNSVFLKPNGPACVFWLMAGVLMRMASGGGYGKTAE